MEGKSDYIHSGRHYDYIAESCVNLEELGGFSSERLEWLYGFPSLVLYTTSWCHFFLVIVVDLSIAKFELN